MQKTSEPIADPSTTGTGSRVAFLVLILCIALVSVIGWVYWVAHGDGTIIEVRRYDNGVIHQKKTLRPGPGGRLLPDGPLTLYYDSGKVQEELNYVQGHLQGNLTLWYENGHKKAESVWEEGRKVGEWVYWDLNGNPTDEPPADTGGG